MKKFLSEFKEFALRGNVLDMAIGVVIGGAFGKITLLRNNAGMFINQRLKPEYEAETGEQIGWSEFSAMAEGHAGSIPLFDVNAARFFNPASMSGAIRADLQEHGGVTGTATKPEAGVLAAEEFRAIVAAVDIPVVAIGGVNAATVPCLSELDVDGAAVVSAIFAADDIEAATRELSRIIDETLSI